MFKQRLTVSSKKFNYSAYKKDIAKLKERIDEEFDKTENMKDYGMRARQFDYFIELKRKALETNPNVSNAYFKDWEIIEEFDLVERSAKDGKLNYFDNAAFPGSFIVATRELVETRYPELKFNWIANSIVEKNDKGKSNYLEDRYGLWKNNPENWLMHDKNNGDVTIEANRKDALKQIQKKLGHIDLYSSDLGMDFTNRWNEKEDVQYEANKGQILYGIESLREGGNMFIKQFTFFEERTIKLMEMIAKNFEYCFIVEPVSSRILNDETYVVGVNKLSKPKAGSLDMKKVYEAMEMITNNTISAHLKMQKKEYPEKVVKQAVENNWLMKYKS